MTQSHITVIRKTVSRIASGQFLNLWRRAGLFAGPVVAAGLAVLLLLLPLSTVVTSLMRGPHGIHTTSSSSQLSEACEDSSFDDDVLSFTYPWQLLAKAESVVAHPFSPRPALALLTGELPTAEQTGVRAIAHGRAPPLLRATYNV